jgi:hypothetical protein
MQISRCSSSIKSNSSITLCITDSPAGFGNQISGDKSIVEAVMPRRTSTRTSDFKTCDLDVVLRSVALGNWTSGDQDHSQALALVHNFDA